MSLAERLPPAAGGFHHDALLFDDAGRLAAAAGRFAAEGLAAGDAVVVATGAWAAGVIRDAVDDDRLLVLDRRDVYRARTPAAITAFRELGERHATGGVTRVRVIGEVDFGSSEQDRIEWQRYEAVVNHALAAWPLWGLCVFDTQRLPDPVLDAALRTHGGLAGPGGRAGNPDFVDPAAYVRALPVAREPLEETEPLLQARAVTDFIRLRHSVAAELARTPGPRDAVEDFLLAVDEMTSNAVRHGRPPVDLRLWASADRLVCRIADSGEGVADPFAGYGPAHGEDLSRGGMGLWLARQLCDHVDVIRDRSGAQVRLITHLR
ncbi:anti-sigma factor RsbA family regulatory protein [Trujillonella humicola]|uniref:anti-sigma factor RsbA family regulatory protein n=1 Tax=Trujillonella humicola TaxID=3383699 RepID=UPI0039061BB0